MLDQTQAPYQTPVLDNSDCQNGTCPWFISREMWLGDPHHWIEIGLRNGFESPQGDMPNGAQGCGCQAYYQFWEDGATGATHVIANISPDTLADDGISARVRRHVQPHHRRQNRRRFYYERGQFLRRFGHWQRDQRVDYGSAAVLYESIVPILVSRRHGWPVVRGRQPQPGNARCLQQYRHRQTRHTSAGGTARRTSSVSVKEACKSFRAKRDRPHVGRSPLGVMWLTQPT